jgi:hypothetical protein
MEVHEQRQEIDAMGASGNGGNGNGDAEGGPARITIEDALAAFGEPRDPERAGPGGPATAAPEERVIRKFKCRIQRRVQSRPDPNRVARSAADANASAIDAAHAGWPHNRCAAVAVGPMRADRAMGSGAASVISAAGADDGIGF